MYTMSNHGLNCEQQIGEVAEGNGSDLGKSQKTSATIAAVRVEFRTGGYPKKREES
jgi:hypothetical protein